MSPAVLAMSIAVIVPQFGYGPLISGLLRPGSNVPGRLFGSDGLMAVQVVPRSVDLFRTLPA